MPELEALPTFFLIGASKAGTTALHHYLSCHPQIAMTEPKEPHVLIGSDFRARAAWYEQILDGRKPFRGEASTGYTVAPKQAEVPANIAALIPEARLIYLVRDPIERTIAHYAQEVTVGGENRPLEEAVDPSDFANPYVAASSYARQVENYLHHFPRESLLVLESTALQRQRRAALRKVFAHIGAEPEFWDPSFELEHNVRGGENVRLGDGAQRLLRTQAASAYRAVLPQSARHRLAPRVRRVLGGREVRPDPPPELMNRLRKALGPEVTRLRELTGEQYEGWSI